MVPAWRRPSIWSCLVAFSGTSTENLLPVSMRRGLVRTSRRLATEGVFILQRRRQPIVGFFAIQYFLQITEVIAALVIIVFNLLRGFSGDLV